MNNDFEQFSHIIKKLTNPSEDKLNQLYKIIEIRTLRKNEHFLTTGSIPTNFAFISKGLFRLYFVNEDGKEVTQNFLSENNILGSYTAMTQKTPSVISIQALEDSVIYVISYTNYKELINSDIYWQHLHIKLLEWGYATKEKRERELLCYKAEERYLLFIKEFPHIEKRVKQNQIATYLGITPIAFSRIKKSLYKQIK